MIALAATLAIAADSRQDATSWLLATESALAQGDVHTADSLFTVAPQDAPPHAHEILKARLAASRGDWRRTDAVLRSWNAHPQRRGSTGEVLFWQGWSALHQGNIPRADSLFVLASAYVGDPRAQDALEYRFAAMLENTSALQDYLRGLPESPLPTHLRASSLERVPETSRLRPHALWHLALIREAEADTSASLAILQELSRDLSLLPGRRAAARLAFLQEAVLADSSDTLYETLLMQNQHGVQAEFARERLQKLRKKENFRQ